jgi:uncharacterized protein YsxB (DUF464 family)
MTSIVCSNDCGVYHIDITGHAEANPGGIDLVCGAISTLTGTLMSSIENVDGIDKRISCDYGDVHIYIAPEPSAQFEVDIIVRTIMIGYAMLGEGYPENVELEW